MSAANALSGKRESIFIKLSEKNIERLHRIISILYEVQADCLSLTVNEGDSTILNQYVGYLKSNSYADAIQYAESLTEDNRRNIMREISIKITPIIKSIIMRGCTYLEESEFKALAEYRIVIGSVYHLHRITNDIPAVYELMGIIYPTWSDKYSVYRLNELF